MFPLNILPTPNVTDGVEHRSTGSVLQVHSTDGQNHSTFLQAEGEALLRVSNFVYREKLRPF